MNRRLITRPEAEAEMSEAFDGYEARVSGLGADFLHAVDAVIRAIVRQPQRYPRVHRTARRALVHRFPYERFSVADEDRVVVLSVFHAKRNPRRWQEGLQALGACGPCTQRNSGRVFRRGNNARRVGDVAQREVA